jgi:crotonobetainyl-CoA:carnitine CoA-transferase CaiB-like acyl-CoA transferase
MYYRQYQKQKATDEKVEKFLSVMGEKETDKKSNLKSNKSKRKEMKKKYEDFIAEIEDELGDFDEDELTEDEDGE